MVDIYPRILVQVTSSVPTAYFPPSPIIALISSCVTLVVGGEHRPPGDITIAPMSEHKWTRREDLFVLTSQGFVE